MMLPFGTEREAAGPTSVAGQSIEFRLASPSNETALRELIAACGLPSADVSTSKQDYILALSGQELIGCVGLEAYGDAALLRSFAVADHRRGLGLGTALYRRILAHAALRGVKTAYILTTTAERFCAKRGFEKIDRAAVPATVAASAEFKSLCPASAICMRVHKGLGQLGNAEALTAWIYRIASNLGVD